MKGEQERNVSGIVSALLRCNSRSNNIGELTGYELLISRVAYERDIFVVLPIL